MSITTIITTVCFSLFYTLHIFFHNYIIFCFMFILLFKCKPTDDSGQNSSPVFLCDPTTDQTQSNFLFY